MRVVQTALIVLIFLLWAASPGVTAETPNTCVDCHSALEGQLHVTAEEFAQNIHAQKGLTCASCHGGDPTSADNAMSRQAGFRGKIDRRRIPEVCGSCHSDAAYMRQFNPSLRTDQLNQYRTSVHGKRLAAGDAKVAVCTDCHSVHDIRPPADPRSTVNPVNVATTCKRCHSDREYMKGYSISTEQFAGYSTSVHHEALAERGDLSAPTCTTCHGNHGAAPPGVATVQNVCSTCHVFQAQLFDASVHKKAFDSAKLPGCVTCHSNHRIEHPSDEMVGTGTKSVCTSCHTDGDPGFAAASEIHTRLASLEQSIARSDEILNRAQGGGMEVGAAQLDLNQARDALTKARVSVHSFKPDRVQEDVRGGITVADKTYAAGQQALHERNYRRMGLSISIFAILVTLVGLGFFIRTMEGRNGHSSR